MLRCGPMGPKVCVVSVITDGKLPVKYGNLRKQLEESKIVFAFVFNYFYRYRFHFSDYRYHFRLGLKIRKKNSKTISKNRRLSFSFSSLLGTVVVVLADLGTVVAPLDRGPPESMLYLGPFGVAGLCGSVGLQQ